jgi:phage major head subunit gpT-like protein
MGVVSSDVLAGVLTNFRTLFATDFEAAMAAQVWRQIAMQIPSKTKTETYNWLGTPPKMEDVTHDEPTLSGLHSFDYSLSNLLYKAAIEVERSMLEDDRLGMVLPRVRQLGSEAARHPGELLFQLFESNGNAFDGTAFFADTRVIGESANIDNINGAGTSGSVTEIKAALAWGRKQMRKFQDDRGRPMNLIPNVIVVPPDLEQLMFQALNTDQAALGTTPPVPATETGAWALAGYTVIVNPFLTSTVDWYMMHVGAALKPFIYQERIAPALEGITTPNTEAGVIRDKFVYSVRARYAVGYGDPRYAVMMDDT